MLRQFGAIPFVFRDDEPLVLMITSRTQERWIFPKGALDGAEKPIQAARREAFEEAGVKGKATSDISCDVRATKNREEGPCDMLVTYFPLRFIEQLDEWPEKKRRDRHWVTLRDARKIAGGPDILEALEGFIGLMPKLYSMVSKK